MFNFKNNFDHNCTDKHLNVLLMTMWWQQFKNNNKNLSKINKRRTICQLTLSVWAHGRGQTRTLDRSTCRYSTIWWVWSPVCIYTLKAYTTNKHHIKTVSGAELLSDSTRKLQLVPPHFSSRPEYLAEIPMTQSKTGSDKEQIHLDMLFIYSSIFSNLHQLVWAFKPTFQFQIE